MLAVLQVLSVSIAITLALAAVKNRGWVLGLSIPFGLWIALEIASFASLGRFIDYRFFNHLNIDAIEAFSSQFTSEILIFVFLSALSIAGIYLGSTCIARRHAIRKRILVPIVIAAFGFSCAPGGISHGLFEIFEILNADEKDFGQALLDIGIPIEDYPTPERLSAVRGKNIVVISIESLEQGFLDERFNITPNLNALARDWTYFDQLPILRGGHWTAGALYILQVGVPAFFKGQGNDFFQGTTGVRLTGLGHVLKKAGYDSKHLLGNPEFAGMLDLLNSYKMNVVSEKNSIGNYPETKLGLHDRDLFEEAKLQIELAREKPEVPFALFMSTVDSHFPNGIVDERMKSLVPNSRNGLEFAISAVDYLVGDFVGYLRERDLLRDTAVFILPDHNLMGSSGPMIEKLEESPRQGYVITNVAAEKFPKNPSDVLNQIELPRLIIAGAQIETNAKFLIDYIDSDDISGFLAENKAKLTTLNTSSVRRKRYANGIQIARVGSDLVIRSDQDVLSIPIEADVQVIDVIFNSEMVLVKNVATNLRTAYSIRPYDTEFDRLHLIMHLNDGELEKSYLGDKEMVGHSMLGEKVEFAKETISTILAFNDSPLDQAKLARELSRNPITADEFAIWKGKAIQDNTEANEYRKDTARFIAHAGGKLEEHRYTNSLEALNSSYQNGFRIFELDIIKTSDDVYVAAHDWKHWAEIADYQADLPPSSAAFKRQRIHGTLTPLDMNDINSWFANHPDAILVTDKVNTPRDFADGFTDKNRLMMELFTWGAVKEGIDAGILSAMPTFNLVEKFPRSKIPQLIESGITDIACSRRRILYARSQIEAIVGAGIKLFAFDMNVEEGTDESFSVCNERQFFYGIYADQWDFEKPLNCSKVNLN